MDTQFVKTLQNRRLSPARRIFVLQEVLGLTGSESHRELRERVERILDIDRCNVERETSARRYADNGLDPNESTANYGAGNDRRQQAHREFVALVVYIMSAYPSAVSRRLLRPVYRQVERLHSFAARPNTTPHRSFHRHCSGLFNRTAT